MADWEDNPAVRAMMARAPGITASLAEPEGNSPSRADGPPGGDHGSVPHGSPRDRHRGCRRTDHGEGVAVSDKWRRLADRMAIELAPMAGCDTHSVSNEDVANCPGCAIRRVYLDYLAAGGTDTRLSTRFADARSVPIHEIEPNKHFVIGGHSSAPGPLRAHEVTPAGPAEADPPGAASEGDTP